MAHFFGPNLLVYIWCMARTNIDIDDAACERVMREYGLRTKREAVNLGLRSLAAEPMCLNEAHTSERCWPNCGPRGRARCEVGAVAGSHWAERKRDHRARARLGGEATRAAVPRPPRRTCSLAPLSVVCRMLLRTWRKAIAAIWMKRSASQAVLADTGYWLALANPRDAWHRAAVLATQRVAQRLVVTWPVITETCHLLGRFGGADAQASFFDVLRASADIHPQDGAQLAEVAKTHGEVQRRSRWIWPMPRSWRRRPNYATGAYSQATTGTSRSTAGVDANRLRICSRRFDQIRPQRGLRSASGRRGCRDRRYTSRRLTASRTRQRNQDPPRWLITGAVR